MAHSPTTTMRLKNRDTANKIRYGSPKLQETLREKCRQKMRERRNKLFNSHRFDLELNSKHVQKTALTELVRQEFKSLATLDDNNKNFIFEEIDMPLSEEEAIELENEIVQEQEQWIIQEYEKFARDEIESLTMYLDNESKEVICPICQKAILIEENNYVSCQTCELKLFGHTMQEVRYLINESVNTHAFSCIQVPTFILLPDGCNLNLYLICHDCSTFTIVC